MNILQTKQSIKSLIQRNVSEKGLVESGIEGVKFFNVTDSMSCAPAVYEPVIIAILNGEKEAILDGKRYIYDNENYMCCSVSMPVEAGTPNASENEPLIGVYISLDTEIMKQLTIEMDSKFTDKKEVISTPKNNSLPVGFALSKWDENFSHALHQLLQLIESPEDLSILAKGRLRELYYAVLKGDAGYSARRSFNVGNEITKAIEYMSANLQHSISIDEMASKLGMSKAVFHRKFKQATTMSPIQFVKSMRLNSAAMNIATGMHVNQAAMQVGYVSSSQFSREFKRLYGQSPKQWSHAGLNI